MRKILLAVAAAALVSLVGLASHDTAAAPKGLRGDDVGKKLFNFNVIVYPGDDFGGPGNDTDCGNSGHRVFFNEGRGGSLGTITWFLNETVNQSFTITDCDGTVDNEVTVVVNQSQNIWVAVRLLGPETATLRLVCDEVVNDYGDDICLIASETIRKSDHQFTKIMRSILDGENEEILWTLDNSNNAKVLQVWIMEDLG